MTTPTSYTERSHPEYNADQREFDAITATMPSTDVEVVSLARQIRAWQEGRSPRISDEQMLRSYPGLGSTKTYRRIREGDVEGLVLLNHLPKYKGVWLQIEETTGANGREEIYADLTPAYESCRGAALLIPQHGRERLMLIEGPTGSGKTFSLESISRRYAGQCVMIEAKTSWTSVNAMVCDWLTALDIFSDPNQDGESKMPIAFGRRLSCLIGHLKAHRMIILIDEGHHLSAEGLNIIKSILNATDCVIIIACISTLWGKLASRAWEEAAQLVYNRLFERVRLVPPAADDAEMFLTRRVPRLAAEDGWKATLGKITEAACHYGSYSFLRRLANRLNQTGTITPGTILHEIETITGNLRTRKPKAA